MHFLYKYGKKNCEWLELQKLILWLKKIHSKIVFLLRLYLEKIDKRFSKLLISKDGSGAVQMDKEIKTSKYMIKLKTLKKICWTFYYY